MQISPLVNFTSLPRLLRKCNWEDIHARLLDKTACCLCTTYAYSRKTNWACFLRLEKKNSVSAVGYPHPSITLRRELESVSQDLENLSSQVLAIKERLAGTDSQQPKFQTNSFKLTWVDSSAS